MSREIIFEYQSFGHSVKVSAIDVRSGEEVSITGSTSVSTDDLERVAKRKLLRRLVQLDLVDESKTPRRKDRGVIT